MTPHSNTPTNAMNARKVEITDAMISRFERFLRAPSPTEAQTASAWRDIHKVFATQAATIASLQATIAERDKQIAALRKALQRIVDWDPTKHNVAVSHNGGPMIPAWRDAAINALASPSTGSREEPK